MSIYQKKYGKRNFRAKTDKKQYKTLKICKNAPVPAPPRLAKAAPCVIPDLTRENIPCVIPDSIRNPDYSPLISLISLISLIINHGFLRFPHLSRRDNTAIAAGAVSEANETRGRERTPAQPTLKGSNRLSPYSHILHGNLFAERILRPARSFKPHLSHNGQISRIHRRIAGKFTDAVITRLALAFQPGH